MKCCSSINPSPIFDPVNSPVLYFYHKHDTEDGKQTTYTHAVAAYTCAATACSINDINSDHYTLSTKPKGSALNKNTVHSGHSVLYATHFKKYSALVHSGPCFPWSLIPS